MNLEIKSSAGVSICIPHSEIQYTNSNINKGVEPQVGSIQIRLKEGSVRSLDISVSVPPATIPTFQSWFLNPNGDFEIWV